MPPQVFAITIEAAEQVQREQVHMLVLENTSTWWHGMEDLWFVAGGYAGYWRDLLSPIFPTVPSGRVLVFKVDTSIPGNWAARATFGENGQQWIEQNL
jgi:hypothetical protein